MRPHFTEKEATKYVNNDCVETSYSTLVLGLRKWWNKNFCYILTNFEQKIEITLKWNVLEKNSG